MAATNLQLLQMSLVIAWVKAQAPRDGAIVCSSPLLDRISYPPQFPVNVVPLMDSYDYVTLLMVPPPGMGTWKGVDADGDGHYWSQVGGKACRQTPASCAFSYGKQNNWMMTQHINTTVNGFALQQGAIIARVNFSLSGCLSGASCQQSFFLRLYETPVITASSSLNISMNYVTFTGSKVEVQTNPTGNVSQIQDIPIPLTGKGGMYLGVQETGTCVSINRITVYYFICLPRVANLTSYPTAVPNGPMTSLVCISGASVVGTQPPAASCGSLGVWGAPIGGSCACSPGYTQLGQICQPCPPGTYKSVQGSSVCLPCPSNSNSSVNGSTQCPCVQGYYRAVGNLVQTPCTIKGPPSAPLNATIDTIGTTYVVLSWSPPLDSGGTGAVFYTVYYQAVNGSLKMTLGTLTTTSVTVTKMLPATEYRFTVVAENGVPGDEANRSATVTATTESLSSTMDYTPIIIGVIVGIATATTLLTVIVFVLHRWSKRVRLSKIAAGSIACTHWIDQSQSEQPRKPTLSTNQPINLQPLKSENTSQPYYEVELSTQTGLQTNEYSEPEHFPAMHQHLHGPSMSVQPTYAEIDQPKLSSYQSLNIGTSEYQTMYAEASGSLQTAYCEVTSHDLQELGYVPSAHVYLKVIN